MDCNKVFAEIDRLNNKYIGVWEDVCNIESPTSCKEGVDKVGDYFCRMAKEKGWHVEYCRQQKSGDAVCITMNPDSPLTPLSMSGHMDTVHPIGTFGTPAVRKDSEKIYGPGVSDCKGGIVAGFMAMDALDACGFDKRPVQLLLQTDEEVGSRFSDKATINYICQKANDSVGFLNLETHSRGEACLARKGIVTFRFDITGIEAHSSNCATVGANAIVDAAHKILDLDKLKDDSGITCNCALIDGGSVANTVPGHCSFTANFRFASQEQFEWIKQHVTALAAKEHVKGCSCKAQQISFRLAMELTDKNQKFLQDINSLLTQSGLTALKATKRHGGSDAADVTAWGIPCIDSVGVEGGSIHSAKEYAYLASLSTAAKRIAAVAVGI